MVLSSREELVVRKAIMRAVGTLVLVVAATGIVFVVGMRTKSAIVVNGVRRLGRTMRPLAIRSAGGPGASASVVRHRREDVRPSLLDAGGAVPVDDGFVIALPYGLAADWLQNVLASGSATIVHEGTAVEVDRPEVVALSSVEGQFSRGDQRAHRVFGVAQCLRVRRRAADAPDPPDPTIGERLG